MWERIIRAHGRATNIPSAGATGRGVHVGIIDSAYQLPSAFTEGATVREGEQNAFITSSEKETKAHCRAVFDRLRPYAPDAEFSLYQAVDKDGTLPVGAYSDAVTKAIDDGVDIVNLSSGHPWRGPVDANPNVRITKRLLKENIVVVAAAGNYQPDDHQARPPIHCPSAHEGVISVGGMVTHCPRDPGDEGPDREAGPYYWINENLDSDSELYPVNGAFCAEIGCVNGESCITNQEEVAWEWNPIPTDDKPDVLAPMHAMRESEDGWYLEPGTSFAAPLVTGSLACILSALRSDGESTPYPHMLRAAIRSGSRRIADVPAGKYDAMGVRKELGIST